MSRNIETIFQSDLYRTLREKLIGNEDIFDVIGKMFPFIELIMSMVCKHYGIDLSCSDIPFFKEILAMKKDRLTRVYRRGDFFPEKLMDSIAKFYDELFSLMVEHKQAFQLFLQEYHVWLKDRKDIIAALEVIIRDIKERDKVVNITSIVGSSVSLLGGAAVIGGVVLAPFTGGLSAALSVSGFVGTSAGSVTALGSQFVGYRKKQSNCKTACNILKKHCEETLILSSNIESCTAQNKDIENFIKNNVNLKQIMENKELFLKNVTNDKVLESWQHIENDTGTIHDYYLILNYFCGKNVSLFRNFSKLKSLDSDTALELISTGVKLVVSLNGSVKTIKNCIDIIQGWRMGLNVLKASSKLSRLSKGLFMGVSMAFDVVDIALSAKTLIKPNKCAAHLQNIVEELYEQQGNVEEFYNSADPDNSASGA